MALDVRYVTCLLMVVILVSFTQVSDAEESVYRLDVDEGLQAMYYGDVRAPESAENVSVKQGSVLLGRNPRLRYILGEQFPARAGRISLRFRLSTLESTGRRMLFAIATDEMNRMYLRITEHDQFHLYYRSDESVLQLHAPVQMEMLEWNVMDIYWDTLDNRLEMQANGVVVASTTATIFPMTLTETTNLTVGAYQGESYSFPFPDCEIDYINLFSASDDVWVTEETEVEEAETFVTAETSMRKIWGDLTHTDFTVERELVFHLARNETEAAQLVIIRPKDAGQQELTFQVSALENVATNDVISPENITLRRVEYVTPADTRDIPDILLPMNNKLYVTRSIQPIWVNITTDFATKPGTYVGTIEIASEDFVETVDITCKVWDFALPKTPTLKTAFSLRAEYLQWYYGFDSEAERNEMADQYAIHLLKQRISPKLRADDWRRPSYSLTEQGELEIDFTEFDEMIERYIEYGLNAFKVAERDWDGGWRNWHTSGEAVNLDGAMLVFDRVYHPQLGEYKPIEVPLLSPEYEELKGAVFTAWYEHLLAKGWDEMAYVYAMDEPPEELQSLARTICDGINDIAPGLQRNIPMARWHFTGTPAVLDSIDIFTTTLDIIDDPAKRHLPQSMVSKGGEVWYYVCSGPRDPYPNFHLNEAGINHRILFWMTWKYEGTGFLYWVANRWPRNDLAEVSLRDGIQLTQQGDIFGAHHLGESRLWRFRQGELWQDNQVLGDGYILYPGPDGPLDSIRLELIRDGVEDYEYFAVLDQLIYEAKEGIKDVNDDVIIQAGRLLSIGDAIINTPSEYTADPMQLTEHRILMGEMIEFLTKQ